MQYFFTKTYLLCLSTKHHLQVLAPFANSPVASLDLSFCKSSASMQTPCPLVSAWRGLGSPGFTWQLSDFPHLAVYTPQGSPRFSAQVKQQPQPGSRASSGHSAGTCGQSANFSSVHWAQCSGSVTEITTAIKSREAFNSQVQGLISLAISYLKLFLSEHYNL